MKYSIIIPTTGKYKQFLIPCVESVIRNSVANFEVIVVNNGPGDDSLYEIFKSQIYHPQLIFCSYGYNLGAANAINVGVGIARGEYIVILNDDTIIQGKNWLQLLEEPFVDPEVVATGPLKLFSPETGMEFLVFFCVMISRDAMDAYPISTDFGVGYGEDIDWCARVQKNGEKIVQVSSWTQKEGSNVGGFPIYHAGGATCGNISNWNEIIERNKELLRRKYL